MPGFKVTVNGPYRDDVKPNGQVSGTGYRIGDNFILTAGHVVYEWNRSRTNPQIIKNSSVDIEIQQVLINLITNGLEAAAARPPGEVIVAAEIEQQMVRISVTDSGPGFAPEVAGHLFEPFVSTKADGLGVGLSICRTIVESHGGKIDVDEDKDRRTRVSITLPIAGAEGHEVDLDRAA